MDGLTGEEVAVIVRIIDATLDNDSAVPVRMRTPGAYMLW